MQRRYAHPAWIEVDLAQFRKNLQILRQTLGNRLFCLPVKANAYGHGLCPIAHAAVQAGVDYLGVSCLQEGVELREAGVAIPVLVLGAIHEDQVEDLLKFQLEFTISSRYKAEVVAERCREKSSKCRIHLEVDTGMRRTGVRCATAVGLFEYLKNHPCFEVVGIYSHLAASGPGDPVGERQIEEFQRLLQEPVFEGTRLIRHIANSSGLLHFPQSRLDMVRPGLVSFGYLPPGAPPEFPEFPEFQGIAPFFSLKAKVSYFKVVNAGEGIGYGHTYITKRQTRIVTVPVGYGDGFRRALSNKGSVLIRGKRFPIAGTICMDQFMVDVGDQEAYVGDEVVLIGKQGDAEISLSEVAEWADTIPYEILCLLNDRIPRIYRN